MPQVQPAVEDHRVRPDVLLAGGQPFVQQARRAAGRATAAGAAPMVRGVCPPLGSWALRLSLNAREYPTSGACFQGYTHYTVTAIPET